MYVHRILLCLETKYLRVCGRSTSSVSTRFHYEAFKFQTAQKCVVWLLNLNFHCRNTCSSAANGYANSKISHILLYIYIYIYLMYIHMYIHYI
jgi:hypothetical protein